MQQSLLHCLSLPWIQFCSEPRDACTYLQLYFSHPLYTCLNSSLMVYQKWAKGLAPNFCLTKLKGLWCYKWYHNTKEVNKLDLAKLPLKQNLNKIMTISFCVRVCYLFSISDCSIYRKLSASSINIPQQEPMLHILTYPGCAGGVRAPFTVTVMKNVTQWRSAVHTIQTDADVHTVVHRQAACHRAVAKEGGWCDVALCLEVCTSTNLNQQNTK